MLGTQIDRVASLGSTAVGQREAFSGVNALVTGWTGVEVAPARDLELREAARASCKLPYLPVVEKASTVRRPVTEVTEMPSRLLDVEVVAIYW